MSFTNKTRKKIGIIFSFRKGWMGGVIYIINLINVLNFLDDEEKPEIILFYKPDLEEFLPDIKYPYLKAVKWDFFGFYKGYLQTILTGKNVFVDDMITQYQLDGIYPVNDRPIKGNKSIRKAAKQVAWIPDLQHKFYPEFLGRKRTFFRELRFKLLLRNTDDLVVSSGDVESHFRKFYSLKKSLRIHKLRFVSLIDFDSFPPIDELVAKYKIPRDYFMVSNQFTNHKNHLIVLKALTILKKQGHKIHIIFTGKMEHKGNEEYIKSIRALFADNELQDYATFLGIIPRNEQLSLMQHSKAIVQPSFFEGWNTSIEDAKSLQIPVIASTISVHKEQLEEKGFYFNPEVESELAQVLESFPANCERFYGNYEARVANFARDFVKIFES